MLILRRRTLASPSRQALAAFADVFACLFTDFACRFDAGDVCLRARDAFMLLCCLIHSRR